VKNGEKGGVEKTATKRLGGEGVFLVGEESGRQECPDSKLCAERIVKSKKKGTEERGGLIWKSERGRVSKEGKRKENLSDGPLGEKRGKETQGPPERRERADGFRHPS